MKASVIALALAAGLGLACPRSGFAQSLTPPPAPGREVAIPFSSQWDLKSKISGVDYRIFVAEPVGPPPKEGFPVIYVLDGNGYFGTAVEAERIQELGGQIKPALVVGIGYPFCTCDPAGGVTLIAKNRVGDFTPTAPAEKLAKIAVQMGGAPIGGADKFYRFIKEELEPRLAASYSIDPSNQILFGHSLGGLFVLDTMFKHPNAFRSYIAASPSIGWGDGEVLKHEGAFAEAVTKMETSPRLLITVGGLEQTVLKIQLPPGVSEADYERSITEAQTIDNARRLSEQLSAIHGAPGYEVKLVIFEGETHTSVVPAAVSRALGFALRP